MSEKENSQPEEPSEKTAEEEEELSEVEQLNRLSGNVGRILMKERRELSLTIAQVASQLNIRSEILMAIEKDEYHELPEAAYVVGFVRSYASFLNLNDEEIIKILNASGRLDRTVTYSSPDRIEVNTMPSKATVWITAAVFVVILLAWGAYLGYQQVEKSLSSVEIEDLLPEGVGKLQPVKEKPVDVVEVDVPVSVEKEATEEITKEETKAEETQAIPVVKKPEDARLMLKARGSVWVQVRQPETEKVFVSRVLEEGEEYWLKNRSGVVLDVGKPEVLDIYLDGDKLGPSGVGNVVRGLSLEADTLKAYFSSGSNRKKSE